MITQGHRATVWRTLPRRGAGIRLRVMHGQEQGGAAPQAFTPALVDEYEGLYPPNPFITPPLQLLGYHLDE